MEDLQPRLQVPDHTRIQVVALVQAVIAAAIAFGVPISDQQSVALLALAGVLGTVLISADAAIRRERARNADKLHPQASISASEGPGGSELKAEVHGPVGADGETDKEDIAELVALLRRLLDEQKPTKRAAATRTANGSRRRSTQPQH